MLKHVHKSIGHTWLFEPNLYFLFFHVKKSYNADNFKGKFPLYNHHMYLIYSNIKEVAHVTCQLSKFSNEL